MPGQRELRAVTPSRDGRLLGRGAASLCSAWSWLPKPVFRELTFTCRVCKCAGRGTFFAR